MRQLLIVLLVLLAGAGTNDVCAKENKDLIKANYYYNHLAFHEAIPFYEKVAGQVNDPAVYAQLGDCYRLTGNLDKAVTSYDTASKLPGVNGAVLLKYGQVLMQVGQYAVAEKWLKQYQKSNKTDRRVANMIAGCSYAQKVAKEAPSGITIFQGFNTDGSEFAPTVWNGRLVFTADTVIDLKKKTDNWTGHAYYNIYSVSADNKGNGGTDMGVVADAKRLNIKYHTGPATFTADGKQMYYTRSKFADNFLSHKSVSSKDSTVLLEIMIASGYDEKDKEFKDIKPFEYNSKEYTVAHPSVSPNGKVLIFSSNMPKGAGGSDLYYCRKGAGDAWSAPVSAGNIINTEGEEVFPYWADDKTLYFSSDGHEGLGGLDIYRSTWNAVTGLFSKPENMGMPLNSSYDDISLAMYADGRSTYFSSNRPAAKGGDNVFFYKREKLFLKINVTDSTTGKPIAGVKVSVHSSKDTHEQTTATDGVAMNRLFPEAQYTISVIKDGSETRQLMVDAVSEKEVDTLVRNVRFFTPPPPKDTTPVLETHIRQHHDNIMDTPGVQEFVLDKVYEIGHFYYDYNKYQLTGKHQRFLDTMMVQLHRHPNMRIEIQAHTDCRGSVKSNKILSDRRALSVLNYLVKHGIAQSRLEYVGLGSSMPTVPCPDCLSCTEEQHYQNRVLDFRVLHL